MRRFLLTSGLSVALLAPVLAQAIEFVPSISIPGVATAGQKITITGSTFGEYIVGIYGTSVSVGAILSTIVLLVAGFVWLTAAGNVGQIETAKDIAGGAVSGLALLLLSWVLLNTINPNLVNFKTLEIKTISNVPLQTAGPSQTVTQGSCEFLTAAELPTLQNEARNAGATWVLSSVEQCGEAADASTGRSCYCLQQNTSGGCGGPSGRQCGSDLVCNIALDCSNGKELPRGEYKESVDIQTAIGCCLAKGQNGDLCARGFNCISGYCDNGQAKTSVFPAIGLCAPMP